MVQSYLIIVLSWSYQDGVMISSRPKTTDEHEVQYERDSTTIHPRSSKIEDLNGNVDDSDGERSRFDCDGAKNQLSDHSRSSSSASDRSRLSNSGQFKRVSNTTSHYSDDEEEKEVKFRKGNNYRILHR